jgi:hypothetical protein
MRGMFKRVDRLALQPAWHVDAPAKRCDGNQARSVQALPETVSEADRATLARESNAP